MDGPLDGIRVVELGVWVAGPAAGGILADWGADVIKIEPPSGDPARMFAAMLGTDINPPFEMDNRSKRSVVLDLASDDGRVTALELLGDADVFVTNVRPGALHRLGLDYDTVAGRYRYKRSWPLLASAGVTVARPGSPRSSRLGGRDVVPRILGRWRLPVARGCCGPAWLVALTTRSSGRVRVTPLRRRAE